MKKVKVEVYGRYSGRSTHLFCHVKPDGNLWVTYRAWKSAIDRICGAGYDYLKCRENSFDVYNGNRLLAVVA